MRTTTWETKCKKCGEIVYHYPVKLLIESKKEETELDMSKRMVFLTCSDCKKTINYEFPKEFKQIC